MSINFALSRENLKFFYPRRHSRQRG